MAGEVALRSAEQLVGSAPPERGLLELCRLGDPEGFARLVAVHVRMGSALGLSEGTLKSRLAPAHPAAGVSVPRAREALPDLPAQVGEGLFFLETVVARDGSVTTVRLLNGDSGRGRPADRCAASAAVRAWPFPWSARGREPS